MALIWAPFQQNQVCSTLSIFCHWAVPAVSAVSAVPAIAASCSSGLMVEGWRSAAVWSSAILSADKTGWQFIWKRVPPSNFSARPVPIYHTVASVGPTSTAVAFITSEIIRYDSHAEEICLLVGAHH